MLSREKKTLDDFRRWKVRELGEFLRNHGLKTMGTKDEFTAFGFQSGAAICTCESNRGRGNNTKTSETNSDSAECYAGL